MDALNAYIPMDRRQAMIRGSELPDRTTGAALFADISGFTSLTGALAAELGRQRGAEEVLRQINPVYDAMIAQLHRYGGSVIGFAGDAVTCWFDETPLVSLSGAAVGACRRAVACALAMQQAMTHLAVVKTPAGTPVSLGVKVAVAAGPARRFLVGDSEIQVIDALAGATLERMAAAEGQAEKGEVVISQEVVTALGDEVTVAEWRTEEASPMRAFAVVSDLTARQPTPWPAIPAGALSEQMTRGWVVPPIYERLRMGGDFLGDLRPVVPLFLKFGGLDFDEEDDAGERLDGYIRWVQSVVTRLEGTLIQLTIGDKGCFFYAAFGAPIAHEDDAERAVAAALELQAPPPALSFIGQVQIGISLGEVWTGNCGAQIRRTYGVMGNQVNMSARLMGKSKPGQILVHYGVQEAVSEHFDFNSLGEIMVKGRATPLPVSEVVERRAAAPAQPAQVSTPMVGRQKEVALLSAALDAVQAGGCRVQIVYGEAGIGKSRLVAELLRLVQERGLTKLLGAGQSISQYTPYRAGRGIFETYFGLDQIIDQATRQQRVKRLVSKQTPEQIERLPLLNDLLNLALPDTELTASLDPALRQKSLLVFLLTLLRAWAREQPLIVIVEDAHWLDSLSWDLVVQVARGLISSGDPLLLVLVTRPLAESSVGAPHLAALRALPETDFLTLDTLGDEDIVSLVTSHLGLPAQSLPEQIATLVRTRANGNPFFAEELLFTLHDQGVIRIESEPTPHCLISGELEQISVPDTIQGLVLARIDQLPSDKQLVLKVAAVIGRTFAYTPLHYTFKQHVTRVTRQLEKQLDDLSQRDFTRLDSADPDLTYIFKHIITQEVAYQTLLFAQRRVLHRIVAEWYETTFGDQSSDPLDHSPLASYYPLLVHHYHHAEESERERHYAKLAGEQAAAQYANQEAIRYFSRALELTEESDFSARYDLLLAREKVYDWQGKREEQAQDLHTLAHLAGDDEQKQATVSLRQAKYARRTGDNPEALSVVQQAIGYAAKAQHQAMQAEGYYIWGLTLRKQANYDAAQQRLEQALTLARASQQPKIEADSLQQLGVVNYYRGNLSVAAQYHQQALPIYRAALERKGEADCLVMLGLVHTDIGEYLAGQENFRQALPIYQTIGYRLGETIVLGNLGTNYCYLGEYEYARDYQQEALSISQEIGDREGEGFCLCNLALLDYYLGDDESARSDCQQALGLHQEIGDRHLEGYTLTYLGHTLADSGELQSATEAYQKAIQVRRELGQEKLVMDDLAGLARVAMREGNNSQALRYVEEILAWIESHGTEGIEYPLQVYLTCYQVLQTTSDGNSEADARADTILTTAHTMLQEQAAKIKDEALRGQFLQNVPFNREIMAAWKARSPES